MQTAARSPPFFPTLTPSPPRSIPFSSPARARRRPLRHPRTTWSQKPTDAVNSGIEFPPGLTGSHCTVCRTTCLSLRSTTTPIWWMRSQVVVCPFTNRWPFCMLRFCMLRSCMNNESFCMIRFCMLRSCMNYDSFCMIRFCMLRHCMLRNCMNQLVGFVFCMMRFCMIRFCMIRFCMLCMPPNRRIL